MPPVKAATASRSFRRRASAASRHAFGLAAGSLRQCPDRYLAGPPGRGYPGSMGAVERLCYTGRRGMGALEYLPATVQSRSRAIRSRSRPWPSWRRRDPRRAVGDQGKLRKRGPGTGARRDPAGRHLGRRGPGQALLAFNRRRWRSAPVSSRCRPGSALDPQVRRCPDQSREIGEPRGYGDRVRLRTDGGAAGIEMTDCHLLEDAGRRHFMTRRFDRTESGRRLQYSRWPPSGTSDFNLPGQIPTSRPSG